MLGIGADPIPPPGPEAISGKASNENKAIAVAARFMDFLLCRRIMNLRGTIRRLRRCDEMKTIQSAFHLRNLRISEPGDFRYRGTLSP